MHQSRKCAMKHAVFTQVYNCKTLRCVIIQTIVCNRNFAGIDIKTFNFNIEI